ncbi:nuclear transport factor 2 family protein [Streptomyces sp. SM11]|uniref:nuclear transport factor 2 family protein n=1 Tax=Streptomyces sp. SM11 TaxID=565557 RepID=UPI001CA502AE|nr:hypothetical protein [Streptomyces sp. SM11]
MPWAGTSVGPQAFIFAFTLVNTYWTVEDFTVTDIFAAGENVAVFGSFIYRSVATSHQVHSPFSIHSKVRNGRIVHFQFMEDTYATGRSFSMGGHWAVKSDPQGEAFDVHSPSP